MWEITNFCVCVSQCDGEPLLTEPEPAEHRGRPVQLQDHLAGVCGGLGLLEGPAAAGGHRPPLPGHRLLRQWGPAFLHQPAGAGALSKGWEEGCGRGSKINEWRSVFSFVCIEQKPRVLFLCCPHLILFIVVLTTSYDPVSKATQFKKYYKYF